MGSLFTLFCANEGITDDDWAHVPDKIRQSYERLVAENARLHEQNQQSSRNSSIPPSKDRLQHTRPRRTRISGKHPGGQPGHRGVTRPAVPPEQITHTHDVVPETCPCGHHFPADTPTTGAPYPHLVFELPPLQPIITAYQLHHRTCPACGATLRAPRPAGVPAGTLGPHAQALVATLTGEYHLAKRQVSALLRTLFGLPLSAASVCRVEATVSAVLATPVAEAHATVAQAAWAHVDESGWVQRCGLDPDQPDGTPLKRAWLWSATTPDVTVYLIRRSRARATARDLLGLAKDATTCRPVVITDRLPVYDFLRRRFRQLCWAHLDRDFLALSERAHPVAQRIGTALLAQGDALFHAWHRYREGALTFAALGRVLAPVRTRVATLLLEGQRHADATTQTFCHNVWHLEPALWTFLRVEGVAPTNNAAERSQRRGVMKRARSFGTQSSAGSRFVERILTTVATCHQHHTDPLTYLTQALHAHWHGQPLPAFVPT